MICKHGNALLLILSTIFVVQTALFNSWIVSSLRIDVLRERELYYKRFYLADRFLKKLVQQTIADFSRVIKCENLIKVDFSEKTKPAGYSCYGHVCRVFVKNKAKPDELLLQLFLLEGQRTVVNLKCILTKKRIKGYSKNIFIMTGYTLA